MEVRYLAITMIIPLLLTGCTGNLIGDAVLHGVTDAPSRNFMKALRMRLELQKNENCTEDNPKACAEAWREISDADFCKRYSPTNKLVAREIERRKLDCSKLGDSVSSK